MYVTVLDVRGTHVNNPDCPMRIVQTPKGGWACLDCGFEIVQRRVDVRQIMETTRAVIKMLENITDHHGIVHRARELLKLELERLGIEKRHILNTPIFDGLEPDNLAQRMGGKLKQVHGRPPVSTPMNCTCKSFSGSDRNCPIHGHVPDGFEGNRG